MKNQIINFKFSFSRLVTPHWCIYIYICKHLDVITIWTSYSFYFSICLQWHLNNNNVFSSSSLLHFICRCMDNGLKVLVLSLFVFSISPKISTLVFVSQVGMHGTGASSQPMLDSWRRFQYECYIQLAVFNCWYDQFELDVL